MNTKEIKAKAIKKINELIEVMEDRMYEKKEYNGQVYNIAYIDFRYKNVNYDDVDNILKNMHLGDIIEALELRKEVRKIINNGINIPSIDVLIATIFNLGIIQGKREVRKRKAKAVRGGKYYV